VWVWRCFLLTVVGFGFVAWRIHRRHAQAACDRTTIQFKKESITP
jgi:hypothetical protein